MPISTFDYPEELKVYSFEELGKKPKRKKTPLEMEMESQLKET